MEWDSRRKKFGWVSKLWLVNGELWFWMCDSPIQKCQTDPWYTLGGWFFLGRPLVKHAAAGEWNLLETRWMKTVSNPFYNQDEWLCASKKWIGKLLGKWMAEPPSEGVVGRTMGRGLVKELAADAYWYLLVDVRKSDLQISMLFPYGWEKHGIELERLYIMRRTNCLGQNGVG
jgi:hypothetical protein